MGVFKAINDTTEKAIDSGEHYVSATRSYFKLKAFKYVTKSISMTTLVLVVGGLASLGLIFMLVAATLWLAHIFDNPIQACLAMGGILFLLAISIFLCRRVIDSVIIQKVGDDFFNN